jgi:hypothetical protein
MKPVTVRAEERQQNDERTRNQRRKKGGALRVDLGVGRFDKLDAGNEVLQRREEEENKGEIVRLRPLSPSKAPR